MTDPAQATPEQMERARALVLAELGPSNSHPQSYYLLALTAILQSDQQQAELLEKAEAMAGALEEIKACMLTGGDGEEGDFGWNISRLTKARPLIRNALTEYQKGRSDG